MFAYPPVDPDALTYTVRVNVSVDKDGGYYVKLPEYKMVAGSWEPVTDKVMHKDGPLPFAKPERVMELHPTVVVQIPGRILDHDNGVPSLERIRRLYAGNPLWDRPDALDGLMPESPKTTGPAPEA